MHLGRIRLGDGGFVVGGNDEDFKDDCVVVKIAGGCQTSADYGIDTLREITGRKTWSESLRVGSQVTIHSGGLLIQGSQTKVESDLSASSARRRICERTTPSSAGADQVSLTFRQPTSSAIFKVRTTPMPHLHDAVWGRSTSKSVLAQRLLEPTLPKRSRSPLRWMRLRRDSSRSAISRRGRG